MDEKEQFHVLQSALRSGEGVNVQSALRKLHSEHIRRQLYNKGYVTTTAFLIAAGLVQGRDSAGFLQWDRKMKSIMDNYLAMQNKLTGEKGRLLREAFEKFEISYLDSPGFALEELVEQKSA